MNFFSFHEIRSNNLGVYPLTLSLRDKALKVYMLDMHSLDCTSSRCIGALTSLDKHDTETFFAFSHLGKIKGQLTDHRSLLHLCSSLSCTVGILRTFLWFSPFLPFRSYDVELKPIEGEQFQNYFFSFVLSHFVRVCGHFRARRPSVRRYLIAFHAKIPGRTWEFEWGPIPDHTPLTMRKNPGLLLGQSPV